ncbi:MAG TPA: PLP-dependent aminotransferase family protein [Thermomicrobiales bacterium]|nr:PLP-dependent aminotransferase family protein [Thermomicrobiales bacterium]
MPGRATPQLNLPLLLDREGAAPLQQQLTEQVRRAIAAGQLAPGARLPSTRALAAALGVSRNVAVAAYDELFAEGYIGGRHGSGTYVERDLPARPRAPLPAPAGAPRWLRRPPPPARSEQVGAPPSRGLIEFRPGMPATGLLPRAVWRQVWRAVAAEPPPNVYGAPAGDPDLRAVVAAYLGRARGIACGPDDVVITSGASQAFDLLARATLAPGDSVAIEEPGYPAARNLLLERGARLVPLPVDDDGARVDRLPAGAAAPLLVYVTPSHQYPLGVRLVVARRLALLDWARANDGLIVEDDYDSEFRFDAPPLPTLMGLDREGRVAYVGTFSKSLAPALRAGFLVAPAPLRERIVRLKGLTDYHTAWPVQRALAWLLAGGHLERHIRRVRREYAERRTILREELTPLAPRARLLGLDAGLHACLELAPESGLDARKVAAAALARGVLVTTLDEYYHGPPDRQGLLLGYGGLAAADLRRGARVLAALIGETADGGRQTAEAASAGQPGHR